MIQTAKDLEGKPVKIKWVDYRHPDLYLIARKLNPEDPNFKVNFQFNYSRNQGISSGMVGFLYFLLSCFLFALFIFTLYKLHTLGKIEVRIPKPFRVFCFKDYLSPEEKAEIKRL